MRYCKSCHINYHTPLTNCMFCNNELHKLNNTPEEHLYPPIVSERNNSHFLLKLYFFLYIITNIICTFIDYKVSVGFFWSHLVLTYTSYGLMLLVLYIGNYTNALKIFLTFILSIGTLLLTGFILENYHWGIDFVLPFGIILTNLTMTFFVIGKPTKLYDNAIYLLVGSLLGFIPLILVVKNITITAWPSITCTLYCVFTFLALFIFSSKGTKEELIRRLHI